MSSLLIAALAFGAFAGLLAASLVYLHGADNPVRSGLALDDGAPHRRRSPRRPVRKRAFIVFQWGSIGCRVLNLSHSPALCWRPMMCCIAPGNLSSSRAWAGSAK